MLYVLVGDVYLMFVYIDLRSLYVIFRFAFYSFFLFFIFFLLFFFFLCCFLCVFFFFFQAEDGIRDADVTGVQTCALPILKSKGTSSNTPWSLMYSMWAWPSSVNSWNTESFTPSNSSGSTFIIWHSCWLNAGVAFTQRPFRYSSINPCMRNTSDCSHSISLGLDKWLRTSARPSRLGMPRARAAAPRRIALGMQ